jgi:tetratricopeptide (TPR) repeat protein
MSTEHFGKLLTQGLKSIAALEKIDLTDFQNEIGREIGVSVWTIYKWRDGTSIPNDDRTIALLARACVQRGRLDRQWLVSFLSHTIYSNKQALITELCPGDQDNVLITHNLPRCQHSRLIGRERELNEIKTYLSTRHRVGVICISGGGGVGKTALALEIAHECRKEANKLPPEERFDAIIWVTAKNAELLPAGQVARQPTFNDLEGVYRAIADLLDIPAIFRSATQGEQNIIISRFLTEHRILLILDNLESVDDQELMVFLRDLPAPSKALITTRHRIDVAVPVYLHMLSEDMALELVFVECETHNLSLNDSQIKMLLQRTGGLPLAIIRTIGRMVWRGSSIEVEIQQLADINNQIYDFCFGKTIALIRPGHAYQMFLTLAIFSDEARREALGFVAGFGSDSSQRDESLSDLEVLSLCNKNKEHFGLETLTRTQAFTELYVNPVFETEARERWMQWYIDFTAQYGGKDEQELHLRYDHLDTDWENILGTINWCIDHARYENAIALWHNVRDFTHIYGYWTDRLKLLNWIINEAERRHDWHVAIQAMYDKAFTLTLAGPSLDEASALLQRCWSLREYASDVLLARVAALMASLHIQQKAYAEAHQWLDKAEALLQNTDLDVPALARERASILYDRGEAWFAMGDYPNAVHVFETMLQEALIAGWQRSVVHAQRWLAYTAILQGDLDASEQYLTMGWSVVSRINEKRAEAYFRRTFAYYYQARGDSLEAQKWAATAHDSFERLGMTLATSEMQTLIGELTQTTSAGSAESVGHTSKRQLSQR